MVREHERKSVLLEEDLQRGLSIHLPTHREDVQEIAGWSVAHAVPFRSSLLLLKIGGRTEVYVLLLV